MMSSKREPWDTIAWLPPSFFFLSFEIVSSVLQSTASPPSLCFLYELFAEALGLFDPESLGVWILAISRSGCSLTTLLPAVYTQWQMHLETGLDSGSMMLARLQASLCLPSEVAKHLTACPFMMLAAANAQFLVRHQLIHCGGRNFEILWYSNLITSFFFINQNNLIRFLLFDESPGTLGIVNTRSVPCMN